MHISRQVCSTVLTLSYTSGIAAGQFVQGCHADGVRQEAISNSPTFSDNAHQINQLVPAMQLLLQVVVLQASVLRPIHTIG